MNTALLQGIVYGFSGITLVIFLGYFIARFRLISPAGVTHFNALSFKLAMPALYFIVIAEADFSIMYSNYMLASISPMFLSIIIVPVAFWLLKKKRTVSQLSLLSGSTIYANTGNIGIPLTLYVLGSADYVAPIMLLQVLVMSPVLIIILELTSHDRPTNLFRLIMKPILNPVFMAMVAGVVFALLKLEIPTLLYMPISMISDMAIPLILVSLGASLVGTRIFSIPAEYRFEMLFTTVMKIVVAPILTFIFAYFVFGLEGIELYAAVMLATLSTAQTIYLLGEQYDVYAELTRTLAVFTMIISIPAVVIVTMLLG